MRNLKKALALVLAMAMSLSLAVTAGAAYTDGAQISDDYATAVEFASQTGILEGFEDGSYGPQKNLTRAQLATMTYRIATGDVEDVYTADFAGGAAAAFTDTAATAWYAGYVGYAADAGYLKGCGEGLYKPNSALTGYQALAAFLRVVGYNQPGQFTGADWTVQVAQVAYETGALEGITGVDLNAAISREVAAQIIFNILFADKVGYTPAFGYQNALGEEDLAEDVFGIVAYKADAATAPWGQPAQEWYVKDGRAYEAVVSIPYAPVAEYTVAVSECDLSKDLGLTENFGDDRGEKIVEYKNGARDGVVDGAIVLTDTTTKIGAQGTLTEVYEIDGDYWFVQIETFLGQIGKTTEAVYDKNGHLEEAATAELTIFECDTHKDTVIVETDEFAEDDYVLINYSFMKDEDGKDYGFYLTETAPVDTATLTQKGIKGNDWAVIGGETYDYAAHYHLTNPGAIDHKYDVFVDFYGNLIGLVEVIDEVEEFFTFYESYANVPNGHDSYIQGRVVDPATGEAEFVRVDGNPQAGWDRTVQYVHDFVKYTVADNGEYEMIALNNAEYAGYVIADDNSNIVVKTAKYWYGMKYYEDSTIHADNETVFLVEYACADDAVEYKTFVGYKNVPAMVAMAELEAYYADDEDNFADYIYVDATAAIFPGEPVEAYVMDSCDAINAGIDGDTYVTFENVVINGEVVDVMCAPEFNLGALKAGMYTLLTNDEGLVTGALPVLPAYQQYKVESVSGDVVEFAGIGSGDVSEILIWVIDDAEGTCEIGSAADIEAGDVVSMQITSDGIEHIIVYA
ncbi:MAG: S-layer homology domain-containing protein [Ruminiclostridium sp.]|nr:S-layer homology domain-containing protein [Ruminiclostridium sp.]